MLSLLAFNNYAVAQSTSSCTITSTCGYTVTAQITPTAVVPNNTSCTNGYNYNITFNYSVTVSGVNTCSNGNIGLQPNILCNSGQSNGFFSISVPAPTTGSESSTTTYTGTLTTTQNPWRNISDCNTATPESLNCNSVEIASFGPGISSMTYPCPVVSILPIELLFFDAKCKNNKVDISWATASEKNNDFFTLERSQDGLKWNVIQLIDGSGNSNETLNYTFTDNDPLLETSFYRLKQTDYDGNFEFSDIISRKCKNNNLPSINIYPNPNNGNFLIEGLEKNTTLKIFNRFGEKIKEQYINFEKEDISINNLPRGIYIVQLQLEEKIITRKFSVL